MEENRYFLIDAPFFQKKSCVSYLFFCLKCHFFHFPISKDQTLKFYSNKAKLNTLSDKSLNKQNEMFSALRRLDWPQVKI